MRLLYLFGGMGGGALGYSRAGFDDVLCVDLEPQPNNPFECVRGDALDWLACPRFIARHFDGVHAAPPCQKFSPLQRRTGKEYPDLIEPVRAGLIATGLPYVIENVVGAPLDATVQLCGSMFDLAVERHRKFETNFPVPQPECNHARQRELWPDGFPALRTGREDKRARVVGVFGTGGGAAKDIELWRWAMGIDWMNKAQLSQTIPPAYTEHVGRALLAHLAEPAAVAA